MIQPVSRASLSFTFSGGSGSQSSKQSNQLLKLLSEHLKKMSGNAPEHFSPYFSLQLIKKLSHHIAPRNGFLSGLLGI